MIFQAEAPILQSINTLYVCQVGRKRPAFLFGKMRLSPQERELTALIAPIVTDLGFKLLWLEMKSGILSLNCENGDGSRITLDDCGRVSRAVAVMLEETDPIPGAYTLEVGSPGIDRPLFTQADYERFKGLEVKAELDEATDTITGQRRFKGIIAAVQDGMVTLTCEDIGDVALPLDRIHKARLVMSDELIKATKPKEKEVQSLT